MAFYLNMISRMEQTETQKALHCDLSTQPDKRPVERKSHSTLDDLDRLFWIHWDPLGSIGIQLGSIGIHRDPLGSIGIH